MATKRTTDDPSDTDTGTKFKSTVAKIGKKQRAADAKVQKYKSSRHRRARSGLVGVRVRTL